MWQAIKLGIKVLCFTCLWALLAALTFATLFNPSMRSQSPLNLWQWGLVFFLVIVCPVWVIAKAIRRLRGRRPIGLPAGEHVLYLRPFAVDASFREEMTRFLNRVLTLGPLRGDTTLESGVAAAMQSAGEFVAIGRPSDFVSPDGAQRIYVGDASWQETVKDLLRSAKAVIVVGGTTEGLVWEMQRIRDCVEPRRLLLILPSAERHDREQMARLISRNLRTAVRILPADRDDGGPQFYTFNADWKMSPLPRLDKSGGMHVFGLEIVPPVVNWADTILPFVNRLPASNDPKAKPSADRL